MNRLLYTFGKFASITFSVLSLIFAYAYIVDSYLFLMLSVFVVMFGYAGYLYYDVKCLQIEYFQLETLSKSVDADFKTRKEELQQMEQAQQELKALQKKVMWQISRLEKLREDAK